MQRCRFGIAFLILLTTTCARPGQAQDLIWDNSQSNFQWDLASTNWTGSTWVNGNGAIFNATGVGAISMPGPISVNSLNFQSNGYTISGPGPMTFVSGTSTQTTGVVNVGTGFTATLNVPVISTVGFQKLGLGTLELGGTGNSFANVVPVTSGGLYSAGLMIGKIGVLPSSEPLSGRVRLLGSNVLPSTTNVGISNGYLDIGSHNVTIANLYFTNQNLSRAWDSTLNANNGVIGSGTLRVLGEIHVFGVGGNNPGNSIAANVDLGGGTQIVRVGALSSFGLGNSLMFTGSLSNGSLKKTVGMTLTESIGSIDGMSLHGNNTYTGATTLNSGTTLITGTNATQSVTVAGIGGPGFSQVVLQGTNGSILSAANIRALGSATFVIDNTAAVGASGNNAPNITAAQNNDRISNSAAIELMDGNFTYRGASSTAASETFGSLNASAGHNIVTMTSASGTINLSATDFSLGARATLGLAATGTGNTLGGNSKLVFSGAAPVNDATGIVRRVATTGGDLVAYDAVDGFKTYTGYATDLSTSGTNVSLSAATAAPTQTINSLRMVGSFATTIGATDTLTVSSGMMLATGTHTINGGTLAFGSSPGTFFGSHTVNSTITGTNGLIHSTGTLTLAGDLSGLTGAFTVSATGTANLNTNTFAGPIDVRRGTLTIGVNQTGSGLGAITLGVPENTADLFFGTPTLGFSTTMTQMSRNIVVNNGGTNLDGLLPSDSLVARIAPANYTADRFFTGNVTLNSDLAIFGGSATGANTGSLVFQGNISGASRLLFRNGRVVFDTSSTWNNAGGIVIGATGNAAHMSFLGTGAGSAPITVTGSTTGVIGLLRYNNNNSFGSGAITLLPGTTGTQFDAVASSTIGNQINLNNGATSPVAVNAGTGVVATWAGVMTGNGLVNKTGDGAWVVSGNSNTYTGVLNVNAGTLLVNGNVATSTNQITVATGATLGGTGVVNRNVNILGTLAPGASPGILTVNGNVGLTGGSIVNIELGGTTPGSYDRLAVSGDLNVAGTLNVSLFGGHTLSTSQTYLIADIGGIRTGTFTGLAEGALIGNFGGQDLFITYLGGNGNDITLFTPVPEPSCVLSILGVAAFVGWRYRKRSRRSAS